MARLFSSGAETAPTSPSTEGFDNLDSMVESAVVRSGTYSLFPDAVNDDWRIAYNLAGTQGAYYHRCYIQVSARPSSLTTMLVVFGSASVSNEVGIRINSNGTLELWNLEDNVQVGSDSAALNNDQWYRLEILVDTTTLSTTSIEAKIDGTTFASDTIDLANAVGRFGIAIPANGLLYYCDDIAINDSSGSFQTSYPGSGKIIHLRPNAAGDNTAWTNAWDNVTDETPDDGSSLISSNTTDQIEDMNIMSPDDWVFQGKSGNGAGWGQFAFVRYRGMSFRATSDTLDAISFKLDGTGSQGVKVFLYAADSSDLPTGSELASWVIANGTLTTSFTKYTLSPAYTLTPGNLYAIYYAPWDTSGDVYADDYRDIQWKNSNQYGAGKPIVNNGGGWSVSDSGNLDQYFALHGANSVIGTSDTINAVQVGVRYNGAGASANASFVLRVKASASGTVEESSAITPSNTTWVTNANSSPRNYALTLYDLPGASTTAWTKSDLDAAQIGVRLSASSTNAAQVSALWMLVDYTEVAAAGGTAGSDWPAFQSRGFWGWRF